jgi:hypothetical protein
MSARRRRLRPVLTLALGVALARLRLLKRTCDQLADDYDT